MVERIDQMFLMLAQELGGITQIFEGLFSFLKRRTDFFVLSNPGDKVGFPPGVAEQIIFSIYKKYRDEYNKEHPFTPKETPEPTPDTPKVEEISESSEEPKQETEQKLNQPVDVRMEEEKETVKPQPKPADPERVEISAFNGAKTDKYTWNQSVYDVDVQIKLPPGTRSRDLKIVIEPKRLYAALKSDLANPLIQGELFERIKAEKSSWILDEGTLIFNLEKAKDNVWKSVILGDAEIDASKVENTHKMEDFDEETRAGFRKAMYEQSRKAQGLPTTDEEKAMQVLQDAWNREDSPYKGQPFDLGKLLANAKEATPEDMKEYSKQS